MYPPALFFRLTYNSAYFSTLIPQFIDHAPAIAEKVLINSKEWNQNYNYESSVGSFRFLIFIKNKFVNADKNYLPEFHDSELCSARIEDLKHIVFTLEFYDDSIQDYKRAELKFLETSFLLHDQFSFDEVEEAQIYNLQIEKAEQRNPNKQNASWCRCELYWKDKNPILWFEFESFEFKWL